MGYLSVGLQVDPNDWQRPSAAEIVPHHRPSRRPHPEVRGHVVLLHDSGGDRANTIEALPGLIDALRAKDFEFVTVSELAGVTHDQAMPRQRRNRTRQDRNEKKTLLSWLVPQLRGYR